MLMKLLMKILTLVCFGSIFTGRIQKVLPYVIIEKQNKLHTEREKEQMSPKCCIWEPHMYTRQTDEKVL